MSGIWTKPKHAACGMRKKMGNVILYVDDVDLVFPLDKFQVFLIIKMFTEN